MPFIVLALPDREAAEENLHSKTFWFVWSQISFSVTSKCCRRVLNHVNSLIQGWGGLIRQEAQPRWKNKNSARYDPKQGCDIGAI